ncbi:hypothetical protein BC830DRAFT_326855 [Chytriomyces sp. MP71]|nr:hypothetical protein BC830DRAFT_326855 [Chytriomyces sp. MP71]
MALPPPNRRVMQTSPTLKVHPDVLQRKTVMEMDPSSSSVASPFAPIVLAITSSPSARSADVESLAVSAFSSPPTINPQAGQDPVTLPFDASHSTKLASTKATRHKSTKKSKSKSAGKETATTANDMLRSTNKAFDTKSVAGSNLASASPTASTAFPTATTSPEPGFSSIAPKISDAPSPSPIGLVADVNTTLSNGAIVGIVVGAVTVVALILLASLVYCVRKRRHLQQQMRERTLEIQHVSQTPDTRSKVPPYVAPLPDNLNVGVGRDHKSATVKRVAFQDPPVEVISNKGCVSGDYVSEDGSENPSLPEYQSNSSALQEPLIPVPVRPVIVHAVRRHSNTSSFGSSNQYEDRFDYSKTERVLHSDSHVNHLADYYYESSLYSEPHH